MGGPRCPGAWPAQEATGLRNVPRANGLRPELVSRGSGMGMGVLSLGKCGVYFPPPLGRPFRARRATAQVAKLADALP